MRQLSSIAILMVVLSIGSDARAQEPIRVQVRVEPVSSAAELQKLMRQNSVRIALQRHRLWQSAFRHEEARQRAPKKLRHRARRRRTTTPQPMTPNARPSAMRMPEPAGPRVAAMARPTPRAVAPTSLRQLLRRGRVGSPHDLEQKLKARIRNQRRLKEQLPSRGPRGAAMTPRRGSRPGR